MPDPTADPAPPTSPAAEPLRAWQEQHGATFLTYGTPAHPPGEPAAHPGVAPPQIVETFGEYESEYAAIRKGVGILDLPQSGLVEVRGSDRLGFLHRMLTNDTRTLTPAQGRRAFLLNKTGRIVADLIVLHEEQRTLLALEVFQAAALPAELGKYAITEDVSFIDRSSAWSHLALHGPAAVALLGAVGATGLAGLPVLHHQQVMLAGHACVVYRYDDAGTLGFHLLVPREGVLGIYQALAAAVGGLTPEVEGGVIRPIRGRGIGWAAYNTARIEAGTPLYRVDFGPDSLPHETGVLPDAVSFVKGCYLGQEIVARMQNLGHPKRVLVGLRLGDDRMPIAGSQVLEVAGGAGDAAARPAATRDAVPAGGGVASTGRVVGVVSSSTVSPLLGGVAIAFATIRWGSHQPGTVVGVPAEGQVAGATVQGLNFLPGAGSPGNH